MLELKRTELGVTLYGERHVMRPPTVDEVETLQVKLKKLGSDSVESFGLMKSFVSDLGLPKDVVGKMESGHFTTLVEYLSGTKKN